tara:strand:+ start:3284 stop:4492 length:1209 start_codon:yes stop_codon:yes gene_type:complete
MNTALDKSITTLITFLFLLFVFLRSQFDKQFLSYLIYSIPLITTVLVGSYLTLKNRLGYKVRFKNEFYNFFKIFLIFSFASNLFTLIIGSLSNRTFFEFYFIFSPFFTVYLISFLELDRKFIQKQIAFIGFGCLFIYLIKLGPDIFSMFNAFNQIFSNSLTNSQIEGSYESVFSFTFSFLALFYFMRKKIFLFILFALFSILTFKRISLMGLLISIVVFLIAKTFKVNVINNKRKISLLGLFGNSFYIFLAILIITGYFDNAIKSIFGRSLNFILMGRVELFNHAFELSSNSIWDNFHILGLGLGRLSESLQGSYFTHLTNIHSDVIKIFIENGVLLFIYLFYSIYKFSAHKLELLIIIIFFNVLLISDNILIYFNTMYIFNLIILSFISTDGRKTLNYDRK